jgi:hypothetical protein
LRATASVFPWRITNVLRILTATFAASIGALLSPTTSTFMRIVWLGNWTTLAIYIVPKSYRERFAYAMLAAAVVIIELARLAR